MSTTVDTNSPPAAGEDVELDAIPAELQPEVLRAAQAIADADAILFTSGAGLGVDSGLPDFRGTEGFWKAYPPIKELGLEFTQVSTPHWFETDPTFAYGFWFHRWDLYTKTKEHAGYEIMKKMASNAAKGYFVFTSNIDGAFERTYDMERVCECHGAINYMQCARLSDNVTDECKTSVWPSRPSMEKIVFHSDTFRVDADTIPKCPLCEGLARPNVEMFSDFTFIEGRTGAQEAKYEAWLSDVARDKARLVVLEIGSGTAVPTVRDASERAAAQTGGLLVRVNPRDTDVPETSPRPVVLPLPGLRALRSLWSAVQNIWQQRDAATAQPSK